MKLFFPFDALDVVKKGIESGWNINRDRAMIALAMTFSDQPMAMNRNFRREYGERYDWVAAQFKDLAFTLTNNRQRPGRTAGPNLGVHYFVVQPDTDSNLRCKFRFLAATAEGADRIETFLYKFTLRRMLLAFSAMTISSLAKKVVKLGRLPQTRY